MKDGGDTGGNGPEDYKILEAIRFGPGRLFGLKRGIKVKKAYRYHHQDHVLDAGSPHEPQAQRRISAKPRRRAHLTFNQQINAQEDEEQAWSVAIAVYGDAEKNGRSREKKSAGQRDPSAEQ